MTFFSLFIKFGTQPKASDWSFQFVSEGVVARSNRPQPKGRDGGHGARGTRAAAT